MFPVLQELKWIKGDDDEKHTSKLTENIMLQWVSDFREAAGDDYSFPPVSIKTVCEKYNTMMQGEVKADGYLRHKRGSKQMQKPGRRRTLNPFVIHNAYEAERCARIEQNKLVMKALGLGNTSTQIRKRGAGKEAAIPKNKKSKTTTAVEPRILLPRTGRDKAM